MTQASPAGLRSSTESSYNSWLHGFAIIVLMATFLLLLAGGNVTSRAAGLAVPDWPLSFESVNPPGWTTNFDGNRPGVRDEHGHRLIGAAVGFMVTVLAIWLAARDSRRWVKLMGLAAWIAVVIQGVMGGLRVTEKSISLAVLHGCFAQAFLCLMVAIVVVTSRAWQQDRRAALAPAAGPDLALPTRAGNAALLWSAVACALVVYVQLILGAVLRHTQSTWIPHMMWAVMVGLAMLTLVRYVYLHPYARQVLSATVIVILVLYGLQIVLGLSTLMIIYPMWAKGGRDPQTFMQIWLPTIHMGVGALILGLTAYVAVRSAGISKGPVQSTAGHMEGLPA